MTINKIKTNSYIDDLAYTPASTIINIIPNLEQPSQSAVTEVYFANKYTLYAPKT